MWVSLFSVVLALGFGLGAVILESYGEDNRPYGRRTVRNM